jgi:hypothetical protein
MGVRLSERVTRIPLGGLLEFLGEPLPVTEGVLTREEADRHWQKAAEEHATRVQPRVIALRPSTNPERQSSHD